MKKGGTGDIGNILYQHEIQIGDELLLYDTIITKLKESATADNSLQNVNKIIAFLGELNDPDITPQNENYTDQKTIFTNIGTIVKEYIPKSEQFPGKDFQTAKFKRNTPPTDDSNQTLFGLYQ